jgi:hypothetical protein
MRIVGERKGAQMLVKAALAEEGGGEDGEGAEAPGR